MQIEIMKKDTIESSFELQLIVISILIPLYLMIFPEIIEPIQFTFQLSMLAPKMASYILGVAWSICLLFGTFSLSKNQKIFANARMIYEWLFNKINQFTAYCVLFLILSYFTVCLFFVLSPIVTKYTNYFVAITIIVYATFAKVILDYKLMEGQKNVKNKKR